MKKLLIILIIFISFILFIRLQYGNYRNMDVLYAAEKYTMHQMPPKYRINNIESFNINYNDTDIAVISITGTKKTTPHDTVTYKILLTKKKSGIWKVLRFFPLIPA